MAWSVEDLDTPCVTIDLDAVERNLKRAQDYCAAHGLAMRPHIKTHKIPAIAELQMAAGAIGLTCQKLGEAEVFVDAGIEDVLIAYPVFGRLKWERIARLAERCHLTAHVENFAAVEGLSEAAARRDVTVSVRIELDTGFHRAGVSPVEAVDLAVAGFGWSG